MPAHIQGHRLQRLHITLPCRDIYIGNNWFVRIEGIVHRLFRFLQKHLHPFRIIRRAGSAQNTIGHPFHFICNLLHLPLGCLLICKKKYGLPLSGIVFSLRGKAADKSIKFR